MNFKIDTKEQYSVLIPEAAAADAKLTEAILRQWREMNQSGRNFIIDLQHCRNVNVADLVILHEAFYSENYSLVFTNISGTLLETIKAQEADLLINIAPTLAEAIDIISMEILERDLFNEES